MGLRLRAARDATLYCHSRRCRTRYGNRDLVSRPARLFSAGDDIDDALRNAEEALALFAESERDEGRTLPPPRTLSELRKDPEAANDIRDYMVALVPLPANVAHAAE